MMYLVVNHKYDVFSCKPQVWCI